MTTKTQIFDQPVTFNFSQTYADKLMKTEYSDNKNFKTTDTKFLTTPYNKFIYNME